MVILFAAFGLYFVEASSSWGVTQFIPKPAALATALYNLKGAQAFDTLVVYQSRDHDNCISNEILLNMEFPKLLLDPESPPNLDSFQFQRNMLLIYCLSSGTQIIDNFKIFIASLGHFRSSRFIFYWNREEVADDGNFVRSLFLKCQQYYLVNVILLYAEVSDQQSFLTYTQFPKFQVLRKDLHDNWFPNRLRNLEGSPIRTLPSNTEPRSIIYRDAKNNVIVTGYVVKIVKAFIQKHNATLLYVLPIAPETSYAYTDIQKMAHNEEIDIAMCLKSPIVDKLLSMVSEILEQSAWFPMIPVAPPFSAANIFPLIFGSNISVVLMVVWLCLTVLIVGSKRKIRIFDCVLTAWDTFRGLLGNSVIVENDIYYGLKLSYTLLFISGIILTTLYTAYYKSFLTSPPRTAQINTFEQLLHSKVLIKISQTEYPRLQFLAGDEFWHKYRAIFKTVPSDTEFSEERKSLDPSFGYIQTSSLWLVVQEYQKNMERPLFYKPENMYFTNSLYVGLIIQEHCIYREALNKLLLQLKESGILQHWQDLSYMYMIAGKKMKKIVQEPDDKIRPLNLWDYYWIWWLHLVGMLLGLIAFFGEYLSIHYSTIKQSIA